MAMNQQGITHIAVALAVVALGAVGFAGWRVYDASTNKDTNLSAKTQEQVQNLPDDLGEIKPLPEIVTLAMQENDSTPIAGIELEQESDGLHYKVRLADGTVLVFDAVTGRRLADQQAEASSSDDTPLPAGFVPSVALADARATAKAVYPDKTVRKIEIETEDGVVVYSVRFADGSRVDVDATTGAVVRSRTKNSTESSTNNGADNDDSQDDDQGDDSDDDASDDNSAGGSSSSSDDDDDNSASDSSGNDDGTDDSDDDNSGSGSSNDDSSDDTNEPDDSDDRR